MASSSDRKYYIGKSIVPFDEDNLHEFKGETKAGPLLTLQKLLK